MVASPPTAPTLPSTTRPSGKQALSIYLFTNHFLRILTHILTLPSPHSHLFWSVGLKATPATVYLANSTFFAATPSMSDIAGLTLYTVYQPITVAWITAARAAGGDAFDLDPANGPLLSFELSAAWSTPDDDARIIEFFDTLATQIKTQAAAAGLAYPFTYINDAYSTQPVFPLYGAGLSLPKLQATAKKYGKFSPRLVSYLVTTCRSFCVVFYLKTSPFFHAHC